MIKVSAFLNSYSWETLTKYTERLGLTEYQPFYQEAFKNAVNTLDAVITIRNRLIDDGQVMKVRYADRLIDWSDWRF